MDVFPLLWYSKIYIIICRSKGESRMHRVLIIEDIAAQAEQISAIARSVSPPATILEVYSSAEAFHEAPFTIPDIALLDIELPGESGIALADWLNHAAPHCQIIYLTGYLDYAVDVYQTEHFWFVTKERMAELLPSVFKQALERFRQRAKEVLVLSSKAGQQALLQDEILYLERIKRKSYIVTRNGTISSSEPLSTLLERLNGALFVRCHNSFAVNIRHIQILRRTELVMDDGAIVLISRPYQAKVKEQFGKYISEHTGPFRPVEEQKKRGVPALLD